MSEEEKNLEEIDLLKEAEESEEEIREETPEEEREPLTPEDLKDVRDLLDEVRELRGGLRGAADPHMIQKHLDNFLAALCGETPVDSNVRTSTEYWLKRLADGEGGSTKKIYWHTVYFQRSAAGVGYYDGYMIILSNDATSITTSKFFELLNISGFVGVVMNGVCAPNTPGGTEADAVGYVNYIINEGTNNIRVWYREFASGVKHDLLVPIVESQFTVQDMGVNAIN